MGYAFQFITLAGWHLVNLHTFELAKAYAADGMPAYVRLQAKEFARERDGYTGTQHQRESGTGYFDQVLTTITGGTASTEALRGSTEAEQFRPPVSPIVGDAAAAGRRRRVATRLGVARRNRSAARGVALRD